MFSQVFKFELRQQLKSPLFWLIAAALAALAFGAASSDSIQIGGGIGAVHRNAPLVVITMLTVMSIIGLFLITIFVAGAALRDFSANTADMMFATPISRSAYLGGRFAAGWLVSVLVMIAVAFGLWLGSLMPWIDATRLGPTPWAAFGWGLGVLVLPNLFFLAALVFLLAVVTRSMLGAYVGIIAFFVLYAIASLTLGRGNIDHQTLGALLNPFGGGALDLATRYWTPADENTRIPALTGLMLGNRALWLAIGVALLGAAWGLFRTDRVGITWFQWRKRGTASAADVTESGAPIVLPQVTLRAGLGARWTQLRKLAWFDTVGVLKGTAFIVILIFGLANLTSNLAFVGQMFGTSVYPVTHVMATSLNNSFRFLLVIILAFYAGELVWREREAHTSEVGDAFPTPDWIPLLSKVTALAAVIVVFLVIGALWCMGWQLVHGFDRLQPLLYLKFIGFNFLDFFLLAILAVVFQAWANNKFVGYALVVAYFIFMIVAGQLHWGDNLYLLDNTPQAPYSDMNGFGSFWVGKLWFSAYWYCFSIALLVTAALYWVRGTSAGWRERGRIALARFRWPARAVLAVSLAGFIAIGVFAYHNTHGLYHYQTHDQQLQAQA
ncbi:MAG TPA: ABC transporter permease subunit, partial [Rhodanobacteraceae bacterium]